MFIGCIDLVNLVFSFYLFILFISKCYLIVFFFSSSRPGKYTEMLGKYICLKNMLKCLSLF